MRVSWDGRPFRAGGALGRDGAREVLRDLAGREFLREREINPCRRNGIRVGRL